MVPRSRSLLDGVSAATKQGAGSPTLAERCEPFLVVNQLGERFSFGQQLVRNRALVLHTFSTANLDQAEVACEKMSQLRLSLSELFAPSQISLVSMTLEPNASVVDVLQPLANRYATGLPGVGVSELCEWSFLTATDDVLRNLRRTLIAFDANPYVYQNIAANTNMVIFGNGQSNRWAGLSIGLSRTMLIQAIRRVCGFTYVQRYGISAVAPR